MSSDGCILTIYWLRTMSDTNTTTRHVRLSRDTCTALNTVRESYRLRSLSATLDVLVDGWRVLTPEQRAIALNAVKETPDGRQQQA